jgi:hypothetical protein
MKVRKPKNQLEIFSDKQQRWLRVTWPLNMPKATMFRKLQQMEQTGKMESPFIKVQPV